jgi:threonine/homoserine/homoserine lactone efflux protein
MRTSEGALLLYVVLGATYGFAAAVQPGPLSTYLVSQTLRNGWKRTLPATAAPLLSDGPIAVAALLLLSRVPPSLLQLLRLVGGAFVLFLAYGAWKSWRAYRPDRPDESSVRTHAGGFLRAALVNFLNPGPYIGWTLVLGPLVIRGWREAPVRGVALVAAFYAAMIASMCAILLVFHLAGRTGPRVNRALIGLSAVALAGMGIYQIALAVIARL